MAIGYLDYIAGSELSFSIFYLLPLALCSWYTKPLVGWLYAVYSALIWFLADKLYGTAYSSEIILYWNSFVRFGFFSIIVHLLGLVKSRLSEEEKLADTDPLTGLNNRRSFNELAQLEVERSKRYQELFTLVYLDLDNFKRVNDTQGHEEGDNLLVCVSDVLKNNTRKTDVLARFGGDEFGILLPHSNMKTARNTVEKIKQLLEREMKKNNWAVSFSIGMVTLEKPVDNIRELIKIADDIMYSVKKSGKSRIEHLCHN